MQWSGPFVDSVSVLLLPHHRRNHFKNPSGCCLQCRAALKGCIDAAGIIVIDLYDLAANGTLSQFAVAECAQALKFRIIRPQHLCCRAWRSNGCRFCRKGKCNSIANNRRVIVLRCLVGIILINKGDENLLGGGDNGFICFGVFRKPSPVAMVPEDGNLKHCVFFYCQKNRYRLSGQARHPSELPLLPSALPWSSTMMA